MEKKVYLNKAGKHSCLDGTVVPHGKTVETEEDLIAKFGRKFELVTPVNPIQAAAETGASGLLVPDGPALAPADGGGGANSADAAENATDGAQAPAGMTDVTEEYPAAAKADLTVCHNKRGWWVFDAGTEAVNEKPLKKKDVEVFIKDYLAE